MSPRRSSHGSIAAKVADNAKRDATRDLRENHEAEYEVLYRAYREHWQRELGYVDERPAANRARFAP